MKPWSVCLNSIARPALYSGQQWFALIFSVVCLGIDTRAIYLSWFEMEPHVGILRVHTSASSPAMLLTEGALLIAGLGLVWFAFSKSSNPVPSF